MSNTLLTSDANGVRTLTLNRPERMNALDDELIEAIQSAIHAASDDDTVRVVVITGAGPGFCAGLDLRAQMEKGIHFDPSDELGWVGRQALALAECAKPIIAAINGPAVGAGLGLALAADLRYIAEDAYVAAGYSRRALTPDAGVSYFLPRLVPPTHALELMLTGRNVGADECFRLGLVNAVLPPTTLANEVQAMAERLASGPPLALRLTKELVQRSAHQNLTTHLHDEWATIQTVATSADVLEAVAAFLEKREPRFQGR